MIKKEKISDQDNIDWKNFVDSSVPIPNKDLQKNTSTANTNFKFDFHGFTLDQANKKIKEFIFDAYNKEIKKLIVVTGKGLHSQNDKDPYISKDFGILKYSVPDFIKSNSSLMAKIKSITDAEIIDGGSGAFYVFLKKKL